MKGPPIHKCENDKCTELGTKGLYFGVYLWTPPTPHESNRSNRKINL